MREAVSLKEAYYTALTNIRTVLPKDKFYSFECIENFNLSFFDKIFLITI